MVYLSAERVTGDLSSVVSMASSESLVLADRRRFIFSTTAKHVQESKIVRGPGGGGTPLCKLYRHVSL